MFYTVWAHTGGVLSFKMFCRLLLLVQRSVLPSRLRRGCRTSLEVQRTWVVLPPVLAWAAPWSTDMSCPTTCTCLSGSMKHWHELSFHLYLLERLHEALPRTVQRQRDHDARAITLKTFRIFYIMSQVVYCFLLWNVLCKNRKDHWTCYYRVKFSHNFIFVFNLLALGLT